MADRTTANLVKAQAKLLGAFQEKELLHLISRLLLGKPLEEESAPEKVQAS